MSTWRENAFAMANTDPSLSYAEIARRVGVSQSAVWKAFNPERAKEWGRRDNARRRPAKREWEREWSRGEKGRGRCEQCGGLKGVSGRGNRICLDCYRRPAAERRERVVELWGRGATLKEIAEELGLTRGSVGVEITRMRKAGWDLPYRRPRRAAA